MVNQVAVIETFLRSNRKTLSVSVKGNLGDTVKDLRAELDDVKAQIRVLN